jgi:hypothetical protein
MREKIRKILRGWALRFITKQIRVFYVQNHISSLDLMRDFSPKKLEYMRHEMVRRMAEKMYEEKMIEFEESEDYETNGHIIRAKIRVI